MSKVIDFKKEKSKRIKKKAENEVIDFLSKSGIKLDHIHFESDPELDIEIDFTFEDDEK